jgi:hypothetical protein
MPDHKFASQHKPGDRVLVGGDIEGIVERISFSRGRERPLVTVEYWVNGSPTESTFHEEDVQGNEGARQ